MVADENEPNERRNIKHASTYVWDPWRVQAPVNFVSEPPLKPLGDQRRLHRPVAQADAVEVLFQIQISPNGAVMPFDGRRKFIGDGADVDRGRQVLSRFSGSLQSCTAMAVSDSRMLIVLCSFASRWTFFSCNDSIDAMSRLT